MAEKFAKGGRRDLGQALANGGMGAVLAVIYALAEKVTKNTELIAPEVSPQGPAPAAQTPTSVSPPTAAPSAPQQTQTPAPAKKPKFEIVEDEGC